MALPLRQYDYDYDYAYEPQYHRRRPSGSRRVIWFILFLIITWFSLPPWGSVDTEILSHEMDANNTCLYTTIKVENNTHTFAYQVQTVVYLTDGQGNNVASKTEKVAAVMLPGAKKKLIVHLAIPSNEQSSLRINAHTSSWALVQTGLPTWNTTPPV